MGNSVGPRTVGNFAASSFVSILCDMMIIGKLKSIWIRYWMHRADLSPFGRIATRLATWVAPPPYTARFYLARLNPQGYIDPTVIINHTNLRLGANVFIADRVVLNQVQDGGQLEIGNRVHILRDSIIATGHGPNGIVTIGDGTYIQPQCQIMGYKGPIKIGCGVQIAPNCAFYSYNHGFRPEELIARQPLETKGGIIVGDDAWIGFGVIVLDGVKIGNGAVVGAGSVVTRDIPDAAIAFGVPARVVKMRGKLPHGVSEKPNKPKEKYR